MLEITFPTHTHAVRWGRDGDWYVGEINASDENGEFFVVRAKIKRAEIHALIDQVRGQLAAQAPANVNVGAWSEPYGQAQQDLDVWVMEERLKEVARDQVERRGWTARRS